MKFIYKSLLLVAVLIIGTVSSTLAQDPPVPQNKNSKQLVIDDAEVFSLAERQKLERELIAFSDTTSNQIVLVTMLDLQGYEPWEVAQNIGETWGVGQAGFENGIVILIKPKTSDSRGQINIQVGYGLEGVIPDATADMIVEQEIIPLFKAGQMYQGVNAGIQTIKALAVGEYNSDEYANNRSSSTNFAPILFFLFVIVFAFINKAGGARRYASRNNLGFWAAMAMMNSSSGHGGSYGNFTSGGGGFGGGGFGGFGGGGFGGGGAGGSW